MRNGALGLLALGILAGASARAAEPGVNTIQKVSVKAGTVEIIGTRKPSFTTFPMSDPPRFVIDISEAVFAGVPEDIPVPSGGRITAVKTATYGSDASGIARVVIGFDREAEPDVQASGNTLVVKVGTGAPPAVAARSTPPAPTASPAENRAAIDQTRALAAAAPTASSKSSAETEALARAEESRAALAAAQQKAEVARQREAIATAEAERQARARAEQEKAAQERAARERTASEAQARAEAQRRAEEDAARAAAEQRKASEAAALAAAAQAEANRKAQQEASARTAKAEAERKAQEDAARAAAEQQRAREAAAQAAAEQQRAREAAAQAAAEQQRANEAAARVAAEQRKAQEDAARAAAEQRKAQDDAARAASARAEAERKAQDEAALRAQRVESERRAKEETARAAAEQRKAQEDAARAAAEARRPTLVASAERAPSTRVSTDSRSTSGGSTEVSGRRKTVMLVGFAPDKSRVYVRTNEPVRYTVSQLDARTVVIELENTTLQRSNDRRPLDTRYFGGPVLEIIPSPASGKTVRVAVTLRDKVEYQARQDGNEVSLQFAP